MNSTRASPPGPAEHTARNEEGALDADEAVDYTDAQLLALYAAGHAPAFDELFRRHRALVYRVAARILGPGPDSEEVLQEVFLRTARAAAGWEPRARLSTWLYRVTLNRCFSHRRQAGRRPLVLLPAMDDAAGPDGAAGPYERARAGELKDALRQELTRLPEELAAAFTLCVLEGLSGAEAAAALERPVGTVKTHVHRARQVLRRRMARHLDGAGERSQA